MEEKANKSDGLQVQRKAVNLKLQFNELKSLRRKKQKNLFQNSNYINQVTLSHFEGLIKNTFFKLQSKCIHE